MTRSDLKFANGQSRSYQNPLRSRLAERLLSCKANEFPRRFDEQDLRGYPPSTIAKKGDQSSFVKSERSKFATVKTIRHSSLRIRGAFFGWPTIR